MKKIPYAHECSSTRRNKKVKNSTKYWVCAKVKHWLIANTTDYLRKSHTRLWIRNQFSTICKMDYVTNNLAESFNDRIKHHKSLNLDDFMGKIRQMLMIKWNQRRKISRNLDGSVLPP